MRFSLSYKSWIWHVGEHCFVLLHNPAFTESPSNVRCRAEQGWGGEVRHGENISHYTQQENITFALTCNSRRAAGSRVATHSGTRHTVLLQWNTWYHAAHINRDAMFSVRSTLRLYVSLNRPGWLHLVEWSPVELRVDSWQSCNSHWPVRVWTWEMRKLQHWKPLPGNSQWRYSRLRRLHYVL
jgi:hypothetical protein